MADALGAPAAFLLPGAEWDDLTALSVFVSRPEAREVLRLMLGLEVQDILEISSTLREIRRREGLPEDVPAIPHLPPASTSPARGVRAAGACTKPLSGQRITWKDADVDGPIFGLCSVLTLVSTAIALVRAVAQRRRKGDYFRVARRAHVVALASSFVGSVLAIPVVAEVADRATMAELSSLISDIAAVIFCASLQILIIDWEYRELPHDASIACRIGFVVVVSGLLIWQFRRTDPARLGLDLSTSYAQFSDVRTYMLTYLGFFAAAGAEVAVRAAKLARGAWERGRAAGTGLAWRRPGRRSVSSTPLAEEATYSPTRAATPGRWRWTTSSAPRWRGCPLGAWRPGCRWPCSAAAARNRCAAA